MDSSRTSQQRLRALARHVARRMRDAIIGERGIEAPQRRLAWEDSQRFIYDACGPATRVFEDHWALRREAFAARADDGLLMEFGVFQAKSFNFFADRMLESEDARTLYGFDSFSGFSEEWAGVDRAFPVDHFDQGTGRPRVRENCELIDGFVEDTLGVFLDAHAGPIAFIHIDTDTYSPARTVLSLCRGRLRLGSIVVFDELLGYPNWRNHEHRALTETLSPDEYSYVGFATSSPEARLIKAAIRIEKDLT